MYDEIHHTCGLFIGLFVLWIEILFVVFGRGWNCRSFLGNIRVIIAHGCMFRSMLLHGCYVYTGNTQHNLNSVSNSNLNIQILFGLLSVSGLGISYCSWGVSSWWVFVKLLFCFIGELKGFIGFCLIVFVNSCWVR